MTTALEKVRTLVLGNLHDLLDATIDLNSMGAIRQHIRDLEAAKEKIADQAAIAKGRVASLQREIADLEIKSKTTDENVDLLLNDTDPTNDHLAEALEARLISYEEALTQKREELVAQSEAANALADATARLTAKHQEMLANLRRLESMEQTSRAKQTAAEAIMQASRAGSVDASVDNVERRMKERSVVSDARFQRALGEMADAVDTGIVEEQAKQRIAARRAK